MQTGLGTHFNARIDRASLDDVAGFGFTWARLDAQTADVATLCQMIYDTLAAGLEPLTIVFDLERLAAAPAGHWYEWGNELDGDLRPADYRASLDAAVALAVAEHKYLIAPAISNLDANSLFWLEQVRGDGWPAGLAGISVHRYGDGTFDYAHPPFSSREEEVDALVGLCDGLPYFVTEFGYPTKAGTRGRMQQTGLDEAVQAERIAHEWAFWCAQGGTPFLYQINDGPAANEGYGIRRYVDGALDGWKPAAYTVPKEDSMAAFAMVSANTVFHREDLVEVPGRPGEFGLRCPPGAETLLSPKTSGHHELRDMSALGAPDETCKVAGDLVYFWQNSQGGRFAWRVVE